MSTTTQTDKPKSDAPVIVKCPNCGALFDKESAALTPWEPQEFPKAMYKTVPKPKQPPADEPEEEVVTVVVANEEEEKKKAEEGFSEDAPVPKDAAKKPAAAKPVTPPVAHSTHEDTARKK